MDKRIVVFIVLSLGIILGFDLFMRQMGWFPEPPPPENATVTDSSQGQESAPANTKNQSGNQTGSSLPTQSGQKSGVPSTATPPSILEQTVTVETDLVRVELSNRGGVIQRLELKRYHTSPPEAKPVQLVYQGGKFRGPLSITVQNAEIDKTIREGLYSIEKDFTSLDASHPVGHVTMQFHDPGTHLSVEKRLTFHHGSYVVDVSVAMEGVTES